METDIIRVTITGGAGRIAYSLIPLLLRGDVFGKTQKLSLVLLDIPVAADKLQGISLEIEDSTYPLLQELKVTTNPDEAFIGAHVAIILGGCPRQPGMERRDLLIQNAAAIKGQVVALDRSADKNIKVLIVANPANTNTLVAVKSTKNIPAENFTCLTRLDEERLRGLVAKKISHDTGDTISSSNVENIFIFGNHSTTQVAVLSDGKVMTPGGVVPVADYFVEQSDYDQLLKRVQNRGAEIIKYLQVSSAASAAEAIIKHLHDWIGDSTSSKPFSMGVYIKDPIYNIPGDLVYSLPCVRSSSSTSGYEIVRDLVLSERILNLMENSAAELLNEKSDVRDFV